eukprot:7239287-Alexandrium_andersonii.AAC.1
MISGATRFDRFDSLLGSIDTRPAYGEQGGALRFNERAGTVAMQLHRDAGQLGCWEALFNWSSAGGFPRTGGLGTA